MKKRIISIALVLAVTVGLAACGQKTSETESPSWAQAKTEAAPDTSEQPQADTGAKLPRVELVFLTQSSGDVGYVKAMHMIANEISEKTSGKFTMEIHENGSLMTQKRKVGAVARGSLDMMFSSPFLVPDQMPYLTMFTAAYIFQSRQHVRAVIDGEVGRKVAGDMVEKLNVRWLSTLYCEARHLDMRDIGREIIRPEDLNGVNLRMPNSSAWLFVGKVLGANPTPMAYVGIYQGLQTDAIGGQENPLPTTIAQRWYEVTSQVVLIDHVIKPVCITVSGRKWQSLPQRCRDIMTEAVKTATAWCDEASLKQEQEAITFLEGQGLAVIGSDLGTFMEYSENYYLNDEDMVKDWDMELCHQIKDLGY